MILAFSWTGLLGSVFFLILLLIMSGLISGSEVAYFSFSPQDEADLESENSAQSIKINKLRSEPEKLLATILVSNNLVNIAIVIISDFVLRNTIGQETFNSIAQSIQSVMGEIVSIGTLSHGISFIISVLLVTFLLVLFGEVAPKIYANINNVSFARMMATPLTLLNKLFGPISSILVGWSTAIESKVDSNKGNSSITKKEELDKAIELASQQIDESPEQVDILKGILKFGDVAAKQIMKPRGDVVSINIETGFKELMEVIKKEGYSRLPVYEEDFDQLKGILYVKDLLGHSGENDSFNWQGLIRPSILYVPESKKIDDLLKEFQSQRKHMGIVVDEYGGASGIITLEDIMEEVIGDIKDEFDEEEEVEYVKLNDNHYIFEGKTLLNDFCRIVEVNTEIFDEVKGDADSLAGLILELTGYIPKTDKEVILEQFKFKVISVSKRRIEKINIFINSK